MAGTKDDFRRAQERYEGGELVMLIDGSGGMPLAFKDMSGQNPFVIAVEYAVEAKALTASTVSAWVFGEQQPIPLLLDNLEKAVGHFPGGMSYFMPTFDAVAAAYEKGQIGKPAQIVVVSDGDISEANLQWREAVEKMTRFLRKHPEVMFDVIVPGYPDASLTQIMQDVGTAVPDNPPRVFCVSHAGDLRKFISGVINERSGGDLYPEKTAMQGIDSNMTVMRTLRFRKLGDPV